VTRTALLVSLVFTPLFLWLKPFDLSALDIVYSLLSGVAIGTALLVVYIGYTKAPIGMVAPVASVLTAVVPVLVDVGRGNGLSFVAASGVVVGVGAVALCTYQPSGGANAGKMRVALGVGSVAGVCFGLAFVLLALTRDDAGLAPVPLQRLAGLVFLFLVHPLVRAPWFARVNPGRRLAIRVGLIAGLAMGALQLAYRYGDAGPVSVAASQFAAAAVLISAFANRERLHWWQFVGLALASVGVGLMAIG
jgi:drug/metabolite transporter (DMT)-like permease